MAQDIFPYLIDLELMWQGEGEVSWLNSNKFQIRIDAKIPGDAFKSNIAKIDKQKWKHMTEILAGR